MQPGMCYLIVIVVAFVLVIYALIELMSRKRANETDADVTSRQLRSFGWLIVSQIVLAVGSAVCLAWNNNGGSFTNILRRGVRAGAV